MHSFTETWRKIKSSIKVTLGLSGVYISFGQYDKWLRAWASESQLNSNFSDECFSHRSHLPVACVQMTLLSVYRFPYL